MKTEIEVSEEVIEANEFEVPSLVTTGINGEVVVLVTNVASSAVFKGVVVYTEDSSYAVGEDSRTWVKKSFKPLPKNHTIKLSND